MLLGPLMAAADLITSGEDVDPEELLQILSDGIELAADVLHNISVSRQVNIASRHRS